MRKLLLAVIIATLILFAIALPSRAQNKIAERPIGQVVVSFSATPTFDAGQSHSFKITLTGNVTSSTVIGMEAGQELTFEVCQDGVGARTFAWPALMVGPIAILAGVNVCTVETFHYDGTSAYIWTTTTSGGGGSGTVNSGTGGHYTYYGAAGTTVSSNANLDDNITNALALTYGGANGIFATQYNSTASGAFTMVGTEGTVGGAASGKDVIACGDITSHSCQVSNNGDSFRSIATHNSTSPVVGGVMVAGTFPQMIATSRGTQGQPLLEGALAGTPGYGPLDLSLTTNVVNRPAKANQTASTVYSDQVNAFTTAGTLDLSASTVSNAFITPRGAGFTATSNGAFSYDTTNNLAHLGMNGADSRLVATTITPTDTFCAQWTRTSGHYELGQASGTCGTPGGAGALSGITAAIGPNSINNGDNAQTWNALLTTAGKHWFTITENSASTATGTPYLHDIHSIASSTANPLIVTAQGTANGWNLLNTGVLWAPVGTGALAIPGTAHGTVISQSGTTATTTVAPGTAGQLLISNGPSVDPSYQDPIISYNYVNLWTAQDVTLTRTSATVRNPIFSQTGTLQITWASITGSPATCTLQIQGVDSVGNVLNNGSTFSVSPANGTSSQSFTAASTLQSAAQIKAIFACVTYPTTGTLTLDYTPIPNVNVTNTVAVSAASLPLPTGASTSAKQPALGTAGTASADVITIQGIASMTAVKVDGSAVTQPVSGTVTVAQTNGANLETAPVATGTVTNTGLESAIVTAASTNATSVKGSAGNLYGFELYNTTTVIYYLRLYNLSTAPTCSSATGFIRSIPIVPASAAGQLGGQISNFAVPIGYSTGIAYCITGGSSSTDNTNAAVGVFGAIRYK